MLLIETRASKIVKSRLKVVHSSAEVLRSTTGLLEANNWMIRGIWALLATSSLSEMHGWDSRASQFFQIAKQIKGDVVEVIWVGCSQILFVQAYFWCFNLQYRSM